MRQFTPEREKYICTLYRRGSTISALGKIFHCPLKSICDVLHKHQVRIISKDNTPYIPTPEDIERETAKIRETWDEGERNLRAGINGQVPFTIPVVTSLETIDKRSGHMCHYSRYN